ncbi:MAG: hypothetical protein IN808_02300, partial [Rubrobacter sp.]|nr:hypothetical protein [Rubrobacter sp.]
FDFCERVDPATYNKRTLESLIKCGAFDGTGCPRSAMLAVHAEAVERVSRGRRAASESQFAMFDVAEVAPPRPAIPAEQDDARRNLEWEKETLGLFVSDHPLRPVMHKLRKHVDLSLSELDGRQDGAVVWVAGLATSLRVNTTRKGDLMAMLQLDDTRSMAEVLIFPRVYADCSAHIREDAVVKVKGRVDRKEGIPRIVAMEVEELELTPGPDPVYLRAAAFEGRPRALALRAFEIIRRHPGESPLILVSDGGRQEEVCTVDGSSDLFAELKELLGPRAVSVSPPAEPVGVVEQVS